jgi:acyl-coenzyme A thioesterase PaaI-like protein
MSSHGSDVPVPAAWRTPEPGRIIGRGHPAGDFLQAYDWLILEERSGYLKLDAHLPEHLKNPRGQLFGGFTPAYVDLVALRTVAAARAPGEPPMGLTTVSLRVDYFEPIVQDRFVLESEVIHRRKGTHLVEVRFRDDHANMLAFAVVTLRDVGRPAAR